MALLDLYAHSIPGRPPDAWQPLEEHLHAVAEMARGFAQPFGLGDWAYLAGLWHDLGKYSKEFQERVLGVGDRPDAEAHIEGKGRRINHSTAGAQWATEQKQLGVASRLLSYAIAGHHAGLADFVSDGRSSLSSRLKERVPKVEPPEHILSPPEAERPAVPEWLNTGDGFTLSFAIRMLFSCLVDADFLDTESVYCREKPLLRGSFPSIEHLRDKLENALTDFAGHQDIPVIRVRREVSAACLRKAADQPGFFSLTVPTGGGKTLSSMRFALNHALAHGKARVIYAAPYTTIIEQTAGVYRDIFGEETVVEHHSRVETGEERETSKSRLAAENWDAPVVVTTNVQLFESLFSNRTSRCRKLHNIVRSVIILDEAQMLPASLLIPTLVALRELVEHYGCSVVLCTATQPALVEGEHLRRGLKQVREIIPDPRAHFAAVKRVRVKHLGKIDHGELIEQIAEHNQALCVVNSRRDAQEIYTALLEKSDRKECFYLTTFLCPAHRAIVFKEIRRRLEAGNTCRVVSTQLIEAGVDISFPAVFRAIAGVDSIIQAAGRCNRNGELTYLGEVFVFEGERPAPPGYLRRTAALGAEILSSTTDITDPATITDYFSRLYSYEGGGLDAKKIIQLIEGEGALSLQFSFKEIARLYRLIADDEVPVVIRYTKKVSRLLKDLECTPSPRHILRKLQPYTITLPQRIFYTLASRNDVRMIGELVAVLEREDLYDKAGLGFMMKECAEMEPEGLVQ